MFFVYRLDTSLVDFSNMRWVRGDMTYLFNGEKETGKGLTILDNQKKVFQHVVRKVSQECVPPEKNCYFFQQIIVIKNEIKSSFKLNETTVLSFHVLIHLHVCLCGGGGGCVCNIHCSLLSAISSVYDKLLQHLFCLFTRGDCTCIILHDCYCN